MDITIKAEVDGKEYELVKAKSFAEACPLCPFMKDCDNTFLEITCRECSSFIMGSFNWTEVKK